MEPASDQPNTAEPTFTGEAEDGIWGYWVPFIKMARNNQCCTREWDRDNTSMLDATHSSTGSITERQPAVSDIWCPNINVLTNKAIVTC